MAEEKPPADWRVMSAEQLGEALDLMCRAWNRMVAVNSAFAEHMHGSAAVQGEDRARLYEWNRDLCLTNHMVHEALARGRPLVGPEIRQ